MTPGKNHSFDWTDLCPHEEFENTFVRQSFSEDRSIRDTLRIGWELMSILPERELTRVSREEIEKYLPKK